jgi:hypothetical protein
VFSGAGVPSLSIKWLRTEADYSVHIVLRLRVTGAVTPLVLSTETGYYIRWERDIVITVET